MKYIKYNKMYAKDIEGERRDTAGFADQASQKYFEKRGSYVISMHSFITSMSIAE